MPTRTLTRLAAAALLAAIAVPAAPASALPPPGDPPDRPPRPGATTPTSPPPTAPPTTLQAIAVTTNSVVATVRIRYTGTPGEITITWGDGASSHRDPLQPQDPGPQTDPDPPGVVSFRHVYAEPADRAAFATTIRATAANVPADTEAATVTITPLYLVTQGEARLQPQVACDSAVEVEAEFRIEREADFLNPRSWRLDVHNSDFGPYPIPGSASATVMAIDEVREVRWTVTELDPILDQLGNTVHYDVHPDQAGTTQSMVWDNWSPWTPCSARILFEVSAVLTYPSALGPATPL